MAPNISSTPPPLGVRIHKGGELHWVGDGFPVRSIFSYNDLGQELSPFLLLDYAPPYKFAPSSQKRGVGEHPHRGFETVTIVYQGELEHRDSSGGGGKIGPGDVQWMTAANGLVHQEFHTEEFSRNGGMFEVAQLWVNLPAKDKGAKPGYQTLLSKDIPKVNLTDDAGEIRIIAGTYENARGPARTFTPIDLWDVTLKLNKRVELPFRVGDTKALLVLRGELEIEVYKAREGDLINLGRELDRITLDVKAETRLLLMAGEPINEPIVGYGPFVMNSEAEIKQAFNDFRAGRFGTVGA